MTSHLKNKEQTILQIKTHIEALVTILQIHETTQQDVVQLKQKLLQIKYDRFNLSQKISKWKYLQRKEKNNGEKNNATFWKLERILVNLNTQYQMYEKQIEEIYQQLNDLHIDAEEVQNTLNEERRRLESYL